MCQLVSLRNHDVAFNWELGCVPKRRGLTRVASGRLAGDDVPHPMQDQIRKPASGVQAAGDMGADRVQHFTELDHCSFSHGIKPPLTLQIAVLTSATDRSE